MIAGGEPGLRAHIAAHPVEGTVADKRRAFARRAGPQPEIGTPDRIGGVEVVRHGSGPRLVWFHGGGYVMGAPDTHLHLADALASHGVEIILPRYARAPEATWPAPLDDALALLDALDSPVALGGDSAGGHLALNAALARPGKVTALALASPNTDRTGLSTTRDRESDAMNDDAGDAAFWRMAAPDLPDDDPQASPLLADLSTLPPLHIELAGAEILLDDGLMLARRAAIAGVATSLHVTPGLMHMHVLWPHVLPEGATALARLAAHAKGATERTGTHRVAAG
ncbi:alpha/beta hydrolase fold domain-containing protein [Roseobacter sp. HKCCA0434]|uniref:alpha/beta hydrolase fold domain-containing protein n=1 Tax=Roseobacter sp. HKCCA0434 TaxID=3079297 RepID=UPI002905B43F|nr:alpha/beta hydrolase fold domain-containing protein [Roseobacter sp. HKCCA0434]